VRIELEVENLRQAELHFSSALTFSTVPSNVKVARSQNRLEWKENGLPQVPGADGYLSLRTGFRKRDQLQS
jgi:hypothetical protein